MPERPQIRAGRRFTLLDAMTLISATAVGLAGGRARLSLEKFHGVWWLYDLHYASVWMAIAWSLALLFLRLRRPRPRWRRLGVQPGWVAEAAVAGAILFVLAEIVENNLYVVLWLKRGSHLGLTDLFKFAGRHAGIGVPYAVAGAWSALAFGGRWRPERSWLDRLGRLVGLYWLLYPSLASVLSLPPWEVLQAIKHLTG
jgi:hypothetical protein